MTWQVVCRVHTAWIRDRDGPCGSELLKSVHIRNHYGYDIRYGLGFRVWGLGFRVQGLGFRPISLMVGIGLAFFG